MTPGIIKYPTTFPIMWQTIEVEEYDGPHIPAVQKKCIFGTGCSFDSSRGDVFFREVIIAMNRLFMEGETSDLLGKKLQNVIDQRCA